MSAGSVAILGANSQLASDYIAQVANEDRDLRLFARNPQAVDAMLAGRGLGGRFKISPLESFGSETHAAVINFIGVGDPARAIAMGASIFAATRVWDDRVLDYLGTSPGTRYVFMSSGAVYGDAFDRPVTAASVAVYPINALGPQNWYALAKLSAEAMHRARTELSIVDLRVFNYISRTQDPNARFLITDMIRAARDGTEFRTNDAALTRDYLSPPGFRDLLHACLAAPPGTNAAADAYTAAPITKHAMLDLLADAFGLRYTLVARPEVANATGAKPCYYSENKAAAAWGYAPRLTSADAILAEATAMIGPRGSAI